MQRRDFLRMSALGLSSLAGIIPSAHASLPAPNTMVSSALNIKAADWTTLRDLFLLSRNHIHLATFLLASHPKPVADAIERITGINIS